MKWARATVSLCFLAAACTPGTRLEPAPAAREVPGAEEGAVATVAGVRVEVRSDAWTGNPFVPREVTPLEVTVENRSGRPLRVRYVEFALNGPEGARYSALPPYRIEGTVDDPAVAPPYPPVGSPAFRYHRYSVAPYYGTLYPGMSVYSGPFTYDPLYYSRYAGYWDQVELPTEKMLAEALPEGVMEDGGTVRGFLYFERVPPTLPRVTFRYELVSAANGEMFGTVQIPFVVEGE